MVQTFPKTILDNGRGNAFPGKKLLIFLIFDQQKPGPFDQTGPIFFQGWPNTKKIVSLFRVLPTISGLLNFIEVENMFWLIKYYDVGNATDFLK
jgi:hypothetical protein